MLRWRPVLFAVLLILSLPIRLVGAAPLSSGTAILMTAAHAEPGVHPLQTQRSALASKGSLAVRNTPCPHADHVPTSMLHVAGPCGACPSCMAGTVAASANVTPPRLAILPFHAGRPASDPPSSFLTDGIERPPRIFFV